MDKKNTYKPKDFSIEDYKSFEDIKDVSYRVIDLTNILFLTKDMWEKMDKAMEEMKKPNTIKLRDPYKNNIDPNA